MTIPKEARARWNAPSHEVSHSAMLLRGTYPPDINYLTDHYGLTYDSDYYYIDYQYIGSNLRPDVTIIERK